MYFLVLHINALSQTKKLLQTLPLLVPLSYANTFPMIQKRESWRAVPWASRFLHFQEKEKKCIKISGQYCCHIIVKCDSYTQIHKPQKRVWGMGRELADRELKDLSFNHGLLFPLPICWKGSVIYLFVGLFILAIGNFFSFINWSIVDIQYYIGFSGSSFISVTRWLTMTSVVTITI